MAPKTDAKLKEGDTLDVDETFQTPPEAVIRDVEGVPTKGQAKDLLDYNEEFQAPPPA